jgi:uncharacterized protein (DUF983 family)
MRRAGPDRTRIGTLFWRALRRRCPNCGAGGIFRRWLHMVPACPSCGLALERREEGYIVGAYMFNIIAAELLFAAIFIATLLLLWPDPPWRFLTWGGAALMILMPVLFYPVSKTLFLAFDLIFRPAGYEPEELVHREDPQ